MTAMLSPHSFVTPPVQSSCCSQFEYSPHCECLDAKLYLVYSAHNTAAETRATCYAPCTLGRGWSCPQAHHQLQYCTVCVNCSPCFTPPAHSPTPRARRNSSRMCPCLAYDSTMRGPSLVARFTLSLLMVRSHRLPAGAVRPWEEGGAGMGRAVKAERG